jgi:hypothetical protein
VFLQQRQRVDIDQEKKSQGASAKQEVTCTNNQDEALMLKFHAEPATNSNVRRPNKYAREIPSKLRQVVCCA